MQELEAFLEQEKKMGKTILPPKAQWFASLNAVGLQELKLVILGQDPYPTVGGMHMVYVFR